MYHFIESLWYLSLFASILSFLSILPVHNFLIEILQNSGHYFVVIHILTIILFPFGRRFLKPRELRAFIFLVITLLVLQFVPLLPFFFQSPFGASTNGKEVAILYANVYTANNQHQAVQYLIDEHNPDIVGLLEVDSVWLDSLNLAERYEYKIEIPGKDFFGIALYSKIPFKKVRSSQIGPGLPPVIRVHLDIVEGVEFTLLHTCPPISKKNLRCTKLLTRRISTMYRNHFKNVIVAADLNAGPHSQFYKMMTEGARLDDVSAGRKLLFTWNARNPLLAYPLDHFFYRGNMQIQSLERLEDIGSDHYPLLLKVRF